MGKDLFGNEEPEPKPKKPYNGKAPFQKHSKTSKAAGKSVEKKIGPLHRRVLDYLTEHPAGACDEKMIGALDIVANTLRPRRRELQLMGRVKDSGRVEPTRSGRDAVVWVLNK